MSCWKNWSDFFPARSALASAEVQNPGLKKTEQSLIVPLDPRAHQTMAVLNLFDQHALQAMPSGGELILSASKVDGKVENRCRRYRTGNLTGNGA